MNDKIKSDKELMSDIINDLKKSLLVFDMNLEFVRKQYKDQPDRTYLEPQIKDLEEKKKQTVEILEIAVKMYLTKENNK